MWASRHPTSFEEGMVAVMNAGGDTDSNSPPAGAVLGARFGLRGIPSRRRDRVAEIRRWRPADTDGWIERRPLEEYADRLPALVES
ncbi:MAG: ADP-ribosylglycohydrolase family protein [Acidimicrobiaceae bacterium]|nr:ADP-ribosylglycohydrolase family protein [Acidimicrobiaceae bacterium]